MIKVSVSLILIVFGFYIFSCSKTASVNNTDSTDLNYALPSETKSPLNSEDVVVRNGKNYIKKNGWLLPPLRDRKLVRTSVLQWSTAKGKKVGVTSTHYIFEKPLLYSHDSWLYSQDFSYEDGTLDYLKGKLESEFFMEFSLNGKVFMYSIFAKEVRELPPSNTDPSEERFVYQIADNDGDGVFETLVNDEEVIVPKWVLK
jgi:hypothetical protein